MKKSFIDELICRQEGFDRLSRDRLEKRQLELLNTQLRRARALSTFYRSYPERLETLDDLARLPLIGADTLRDRFSGLCLLPGSELVRLRTSGTTGRPKRVAYSRYDCDRTLAFFAAGLTELIGPGDRVIAAFPRTDRYSLGGLIEDAVKEIGAGCVCMTGMETYRELADLVMKENSSVYLGPPILLLSLLRILDGRSPLQRALVSGDTCPPGVAEECEKRLGSRLFPHYGLRESGLGGAMSCSAHEGMHIRENDLFFEVIGPEGQRLPDGEWGELVLTSMGMDAMPLFRYRTGDCGRLLPGPCACGSQVKRLETKGRIGNHEAARRDDAVFRHGPVVDLIVENETLRVLTLKEEERVRAALEAEYPGMKVLVSRLTNEDAPFFRGKRNGAGTDGRER